ncbi:MAG: phage/plasmid replication protein, partial [Muribaculaceae bacterium]
GDVPRLKKEKIGDATIYYKSVGKRQNKTLCFYDKTEEATTKGIATPGLLSGMPLLRYEARYNGRLANQFKVQEVTGATLINETFYRNMVKLWQRQYFAIPKTKETRCSVMDNIKTANDAVNIFFARLINQTGQDEIGDFVNELKQNGTFQDAKYYTRVKKRLQEIAATISEDCASDDIRELDDAIRNAGAYI